MDALSDDHAVAVPDWAETGTVWTLPRAVTRLRADLDRFGDRRAVVVGHSFGGSLATELAARHPERVGHLVLVDSIAQAERLTFLLRIAGVGRPDGAGDEQEDERGDDSSSTASAVAFLRTWGRAPGKLSAAALWGFLSTRDTALDAVRRADLPRSLLWGHGDTILHPSDGVRFADRLGATFRVVDVPRQPIRHQWPIRHPELFAAALRDVLG